MVSVKQLHESLNRLYEDYEDIRPNVKIKVGKRFLNEDIKVKRGENDWALTLEEVQTLVNSAINDSGIPEEAINEIIWWANSDSSTGNIEIKFSDGYEEYIEDFNEYDIFNVFANWVDDNYDEDDDLDESLTEARNPENDEVNDVIRRNIGKKLKDISPEDRELLANNGVSISGGKDNRTYSIKDNRSMTFDKNGRAKEYSTHGLRKPSLPDVNNPDFDLKGWLSPNEKELKRLHGAQYKPSDEYKRLKSYADDAEKRGRRYRKDLEAQAQNSILDNDDYYPRIDYNSRDRAIRGDYEWADRLNNKAKKVASDAKSRSKYYKNESLIREGFAPSEVQTQYVEALEDLEEWLEDGKIDLEDILLYFIPDRNIYTVLKLHEYIKSDIEEEY